VSVSYSGGGIPSHLARALTGRAVEEAGVGEAVVGVVEEVWRWMHRRGRAAAARCALSGALRGGQRRPVAERGERAGEEAGVDEAVAGGNLSQREEGRRQPGSCGDSERSGPRGGNEARGLDPCGSRLEPRRTDAGGVFGRTQPCRVAKPDFSFSLGQG
jgi:hypothetical protein